MAKTTRVTLAAAALALCTATPAGAITHGDPTPAGTYGNVGGVVVGYDNPDDEFDEKYRVVCTGTLIGDGSVFLTAAHCLDLGLPDSWGARFGVTFIDDFAPIEVDGAADVTSVTWCDEAAPDPCVIALHPQWMQPSKGDIGDMGVIDFRAVIQGVTPAAVAPLGTVEAMKAEKTLRSAVFTAVGYGTTRDSQQGGSWAIDYTNTVRRFTTQAYQSHGANILKLSMNPAKGSGGTCYGDSGGPHFDPDGNVISITVTGDAPCKNLDTTYRTDSVSAQTFLAGFPGSGVVAP